MEMSKYFFHADEIPFQFQELDVKDWFRNTPDSGNEARFDAVVMLHNREQSR